MVHMTPRKRIDIETSLGIGVEISVLGFLHHEMRLKKLKIKNEIKKKSQLDLRFLIEL